jgi:uridine kinase
VIEACAALSQRSLALVAIDGLGGSGKSTLARRIQAELAASTIVEVDDFYRPMLETERQALSPREGFSSMFDWQRLRDEVLAPLRAGRAAHYHPYDWQRGMLASREVEVRPRGLVIVEGVYTLRPELRSFWDLTVYLDVSREARLARLLARNENARAQIDRWMTAEHYYEKTFAPSEQADLVLAEAGT